MTPLRTILAAALAIPVPTANAQSPAAEVLRAFQHVDGDRIELRRAALAATVGHDSTELSRALLVAYSTVEAEAAAMEERRFRLLERGGGRVLALQNQRVEPLRDLQERILTRVRAISDLVALLELFEQSLADRRLPLAIRLVASRMAGTLGERALPALLAACSRAKSAADVAAAIEAARCLGPRAQQAAPRLIGWLAHDDAALRAAAADALAEVRLPESLAPLIERIDREEGRTLDHVVAALERLTRQRLGAAAGSWRAWLAAEGDAYLDGRKQLGGGVPSAVERATERGYFYGLPLDGRSVLFVIDRSNSMLAKIGTESASGGARSRLDEAKAELKRCLDLLPGDASFGIVAFARELTRFEDRVAPAEPDRVARAKAWVDALEPQFATNTYDALELAFVTAGRGAHDRYYECALDTIYLLTDGRPTRDNGTRRGAAADDPERILAALRRWNHLFRVRVHVVGVGRDIGRKFLQSIATEHGGRFIHHR